MNDLVTLVIFLGITFTSIGTVGSIIIMCMLGITDLREKCKKKHDVLENDEMDEFVKL